MRRPGSLSQAGGPGDTAAAAASESNSRVRRFRGADRHERCRRRGPDLRQRDAQTMGVWGAMVRRMVGTGYRTVLFDFPYQGRSIGRGESSLTLHDQVGVLDLVVQHVAAARPVA